MGFPIVRVRLHLRRLTTTRKRRMVWGTPTMESALLVLECSFTTRRRLASKSLRLALCLGTAEVMRHNFSVWGDSSLNWTWSHAGHNVQTATLDFRLSKSATNGERHSNSDSALSMFNGMQNGTSPNWNNWSNSVCFPTQDPDPDYSNQLHSTTYIGVSTSSQQC
jgi:hypothetical protein